jgi:pilus assembly protein Flp/PilA
MLMERRFTERSPERQDKKHRRSVSMLNLYARLSGQKGQGMVEYGLILALVGLAVIVTLGLVGGQLVTSFDSVVAALTV